MSLGLGLGLQGKPHEFENVALQRLKQAEPLKRKPEDFSKFIKLDFNKYHPVVQQEALDLSNDLFDYMKQQQQNPANKYTTWASSPEFQRKLADTKLKLGKLEGESRRINEGIKEYVTNKDKDSYEVNQAADSILANTDNLDTKTLNEAYRTQFGGDYSADKHFTRKIKPFQILEDIDKKVLPVVRQITEKQTRSYPQPDGSTISNITESISADKLNKEVNLSLSDPDRRKGIETAFNSLEQPTKDQFGNATNWYRTSVVDLLQKNNVSIKQSVPKTQSLRSLGNGQYTNNDFNYAFVKGGDQSDTNKLYDEYLSQVAESNKGRETPAAPLPFDDYLKKYESVFGRGGDKLVFTRNDKATENKELTFKGNDGNLVKGVPLGIAEENGSPFVVISVPSQKMITKTVKDALGNQQVINVPEKNIEKLVPFKGENQGKVFTEYRGAAEAIKEENPDWLQSGIKVSTPAPKVKVSGPPPIQLTGKINPATLTTNGEYEVGGKIYKWNGTKLIPK